MKHIAALILIFLAAFTGTAFASSAAQSADPSLVDMLGPVLDAFRAGNWLVGSALAVVLLTAVASKYGKHAWSPLGTGAGKAGLVFVGSFAAALAAGGAWSLGLGWTALKVATAAAGGYSLAKELLGALAPKLPAWAQPIVALVRALFDRPAADAEAKADAAGDAAVAKKPSTGVAGVVGKPKSIK